jgi:hypothetical protein
MRSKQLGKRLEYEEDSLKMDGLLCSKLLDHLLLQLSML